MDHDYIEFERNGYIYLISFHPFLTINLTDKNKKNYYEAEIRDDLISSNTGDFRMPVSPILLKKLLMMERNGQLNGLYEFKFPVYEGDDVYDSIIIELRCYQRYDLDNVDVKIINLGRVNNTSNYLIWKLYWRLNDKINELDEIKNKVNNLETRIQNYVKDNSEKQTKYYNSFYDEYKKHTATTNALFDKQSEDMKQYNDMLKKTDLIINSVEKSINKCLNNIDNMDVMIKKQEDKHNEMERIISKVDRKPCSEKIDSAIDNKLEQFAVKNQLSMC